MAEASDSEKVTSKLDSHSKIVKVMEYTAGEDKGFTQLQIACRNHAPIENIHAIVKSNPDQLRENDSGGWISLHFACSQEPSLELIQYLIQEYPDSITKRTSDRYRSTSLHVACRWGASPEVVRYLFERYPEAAVAQEDLSGSTPLHLACKPWISVVEETSAEIICFLAQGCPQAVSIMDHEGFTALHVACRYNNPRPSGVIESLLAAYPGGAKDVTVSGWLPLHLACRNMESLDGIRFLVETFPSALQKKTNDKFGLTPLCCAIIGEAPLEVICYLLEEYPDVLWQKDGLMGGCPLHVACSSNASLDVIKYLVKKDPSAIMEDAEENAMTPLDLAFENDCSDEVVDFLLEEEANQRNSKG